MRNASLPRSGVAKRYMAKEAGDYSTEVRPPVDDDRPVERNAMHGALLALRAKLEDGRG